MEVLLAYVVWCATFSIGLNPYVLTTLEICLVVDGIRPDAKWGRAALPLVTGTTVDGASAGSMPPLLPSRRDG